MNNSKKKCNYYVMILIINNSNRNLKIKNYVKTIQNKRLKRETPPKKNGFFPMYVTDSILKKMKDHNIPFINILCLEDLLEVIDKKIPVEGVIIGGSEIKLSLGKHPEDLLLPNILAIKHFKNKPIFGICFGFQIINVFFNGEISSLDNYIKDDKMVKLLESDKQFKQSKSTIFKKQLSGKYRFLHGDYISKLASSFIVRSVSADGVIQSIEHKTKPIFGTQFHPELSGERGEKLILNFLNICGY